MRAEHDRPSSEVLTMDSTLAFALFLVVWLFGQPGFIADLMTAFVIAVCLIAGGFAAWYSGLEILRIKR